jgi:hypothetical protein
MIRGFERLKVLSNQLQNLTGEATAPGELNPKSFGSALELHLTRLVDILIKFEKESMDELSTNI